MELYAARHGETEFNTQHRLQGSEKDSPLTQTGIDQARTLGQSLAGIHFDAIYTSPLKRATDTVEIVFDGKYKPILDPRLVEIGLGVMSGMPWEDAAEAFPQAALRLGKPVEYIPPPKGEAIPDMVARVRAFMADVCKAGHTRVFVLTHHYTLRVMQYCTMDAPLEALAETRRCGNCEVVRFSYEDGKWRIWD